MREILFRGKRLDTGEWAESTSLAKCVGKQPEDVTYYIGSRQPALMGCNEQGNTLFAETNGECLFYKINPETMGQFTGLTDTNGKKIFEGDIVRHHNGNPYAIPSIVEKGRVYWDDVYCGWRRTSNGAFHHGKIDTYRMSNDCCYEVIGNIHDNPELLDGERNGNG